MKTGELHAFLISAGVGGEWSVSFSGYSGTIGKQVDRYYSTRTVLTELL